MLVHEGQKPLKLSYSQLLSPVFTWSHPHSAVTDRGTVLREAQHKQVHLVLSAPANAEAETFGAFLQLHREVVIVLPKGCGLLARNPRQRSSRGKKDGCVSVPGV